MGEFDVALHQLADAWQARWPTTVRVSLSGPTAKLPIVIVFLKGVRSGVEVVHVFEDNGLIVVEDNERLRSEYNGDLEWKPQVDALVSKLVGELA